MQLPRRLVDNPLVVVQGILSSLEAHLEHVAMLQPDLLSLMKEDCSTDHHYRYQTSVFSYLRLRLLMMLDNELGRSWCRQGDEHNRCCEEPMGHK